MTTYNVNIDIHGPIFDGRTAAAIRAGSSDAAWEIAKVGRGELGIEFIRHFKHPTGYYESQVRAERVGQYEARDTDGGVVYGPWLEGTGSRNFPATRFKGYASFRTVTQRLDRMAEGIMARTIDHHLRAVDPL